MRTVTFIPSSFHRVVFSFKTLFCVPVYIVEEGHIFQKRYLDRFRNTRDPVFVLECPQEVKIIQYSPGGSEGPDKVLLSECVDAIFHSYLSIVLGQNRGWFVVRRDATVISRSFITGCVN